jgi:hypothetical protein
VSLQEILHGNTEAIGLSDCCKYGSSGLFYRDRAGQETRIPYHNVYKLIDARFALVTPESAVSLPVMTFQLLGQVEHLDTDSTWGVVVVTIEAAVLAI